MVNKKTKPLALLTAALCLTGCNADLSWGSYSFHYAHIQMYSMAEPVHLRISRWKDDTGGVELHTEDHGSILVGDGTYVLYDQVKCPLCGEVQYK